jgi:hypothetical protein
MSPFRAWFAATLLALGVASAQPALAQSSTLPPGGPITPPAAFPDLVVTSVKGSMVCTPQGTITATIEATLKNQGQVPADLSTIPFLIVLSGDWWAVSDNNAKYLEKYPPPKTDKAYANGPTKLAANQSITRTMTIAGITKYKSIKGFTQPGLYVLQASADPNKMVVESNEKNNDTRVSVKDPCFKLVK